MGYAYNKRMLYLRRKQQNNEVSNMANVNEYIEKLAARYELHAEAVKHARNDFFVVVPTHDDGTLLASAFVETINDGKDTGYEVNMADEPYTYILPEAMRVAKKMRLAFGRKFTWVSVKEWHEHVMSVLAPYKKAV